MESQNISQSNININDFNIRKSTNSHSNYEQKENIQHRKQNANSGKSTDDDFDSPAPTKKQNNSSMSSIINTNFSLQKLSPFLKNTKSSRIQKLFQTNDELEKSVKIAENLDTSNQLNTLSQLLFKVRSPLEDSIAISEFSINSLDEMDPFTPEIKYNLQKNFSNIIECDILNDWQDSPNFETRNSAIIEHNQNQKLDSNSQLNSNNLQIEIQEFKRMRINISKFSSFDPLCSKDNLEIIDDNDQEDQCDDLHPISIRLFQDELDQQNKMELEELTPMRRLSFRKNLGNILPDISKLKKNNAQSSAEQLQKTIKDFQILSILSKKEKMNVYVCQSNLNQQKYILKEIPILKDMQEETIQDLRVLAKWGQGDRKENEYFVKYYDSWIEEETLYVVIELCQFSLEKMIQYRPSENTIRKLLVDVCTGLNFLHQQKCYHMVIKPSNILLSNSEKFKIADLGVSWLNHQFVQDYWTLDKRYFAPEFDCRIEQDIDYQKCDIYSLGIILHQLVEGSDYKLKSKNKKITNNQKYSNSLTYLIGRMIDQCPSKRPTAQEILDKMFKSGDEDYLEIERKYLKEQNEELQRKINSIEIKIKQHNLNFQIRRRKNSSEF